MNLHASTAAASTPSSARPGMRWVDLMTQRSLVRPHRSRHGLARQARPLPVVTESTDVPTRTDDGFNARRGINARARVIMSGYGSADAPHRGRGDGADDEGLQPALPPAVHRARRRGARERDDRREAAEAEAAIRVRADPPVRGRAVLRRAARGHEPRGDGLGRGARRVARRGLRGREPRVPDRLLHAQGPRRRARPPAHPRRPHRLGHGARRRRRCR